MIHIDKKLNVICVLGMHRSGTSLLMRLLNICGVYIGEKDDLLGSAESNEKGHWENLKILEINEKILNLFEGDWENPPKLEDGWWEDKKLDSLYEEAKMFVEKMSIHRLWGFKEPRTSLTLRFWQKIIPDMVYIIPIRDPVEVAMSLHRRDGFEISKGLFLWMEYWKSIIEYSEGNKRIFVPMSDLMEKPQRTMNEILNFIDAEKLDYESVKSEIDKFIDASLVHHKLEESNIKKFEGKFALTEREMNSLMISDYYRITKKIYSDLLKTKSDSEKLIDDFQNKFLKLQEEVNKVREVNEKLEIDIENSKLHEKMLESRIEEKNSILQVKESELETIKRSLIWRVSRPFRLIGPFVYGLVPKLKRLREIRPLFEFLLNNMLHDIPYALELLKREGFESFLYRCYWYLRQRRLPDEISSSRGGSNKFLSQHERYQRLIAENAYSEEEIRKIKEECEEFEYKPKISVITPVYNVDPKWLDKCIESVLAQYYENWELCIVDDGSKKKETIERLEYWKEKDPRIKIEFNEKNEGISGASNRCIDISTGEFLALVDNDDEITPDALYQNVKVLNSNKEIDFIYSDEDKVIEKDSGEVIYVEPFFKPDWSPHLIFSSMYTGHLSLYRRFIINKVGGFRSRYDFSQDYDLVLRVTEVTDKIYHISKVLYHWRIISGSAAGGGKDYARDTNISALEDAVKRRNYDASVERYPFANRVCFNITTEPYVSIIIPSDNYDNILNCVNNLLSNTDYNNYEIFIVTKSSIAISVQDKYKENPKLNVTHYDLPYNFSDKCNRGANDSKGELLLFLNDDIIAQSYCRNWLTEMVRLFKKPNVGAVSPKLFYENKTIQYAGMVTNVPGLVGTAFHCKPKDDMTYFNFLQNERNVSIITGACMLVSRKVFEEIEGFDSVNTPIMHSDVDISFKILEKRYELIYTSYAELKHIGHLSLKNYDKIPKKDVNDFYVIKRWGGYLSYDPYFTENMRRYLYDDADYNYHLSACNGNSDKTTSNILLVSHELSLSGAPLVVYNQAKHFKQEGFFPVVISPIDGRLRSYYEDFGIPVVVDQSLSQGGSTQLRSFIRNFDIAFVNTILLHDIVKTLLNFSIPIAWMIHESAFGINYIKSNPSIIDSMKRVKKTIFCDRKVFEKYKKFQLSNSVLIRLGAQSLELNKGSSNKENENFFEILHVGSIEKRKGQDVLLKSIGRLSSIERKKIRVRFIGRILDEEFARKLQKESLELDCILWEGEVDRELMVFYMNKADVFICTSRDETGPLVVLEAMSCGKAIISTNVGEVSDMLDEGIAGIIVENGDIGGISESLSLLLKHPERIKQLGKLAQRRYKKFFSSSIFAQNLQDEILN